MKASRKTYYIVNFILLFAVLITSFIVATVIMYQDQKNTALSKSELLTEQVQDDVNEKLKLADMLSRTVFLNEEFQNLAADVYTGDEVIADIYDHFNLLISIDDFFKNVLYIPRNATGDLDVENCVSLGYGLGYEYVQYNLPNLIETAQQPNHAKGGAFLSKLYYLDGKKVAYYALGRNIYDIRDGSYLNKMGVGVLFVDGNELTGMLNKYSMALDGLDFCVEENGEVLLSSDGYKNNASSKTGYWRKTVDMEEFSWTIVGVYDKSNIWDAMKDNFTVLVVIMAIAGTSCCVLALVIKRKSSQSFDYLFNAFSDLQHSNQIEPVPHSDDKEVNQVIDSFNRLTGSLKNLNDEMLKQKNRELKLELRNTEYMLNSLHSQINKHNWTIERRAILRKPVDRIGFGGYLKLAAQLPKFCDGIERVCDEFRMIYDTVANKQPYTTLKVAILSYWGKEKSWMTNMVMQDAPFSRTTPYLGMLEALAGLPVDIDFISFADAKAGRLQEFDVVINGGNADTAFSGADCWKDAELVVAVREYIANGGGFIGVGDPSAVLYGGRFFQLADALGVDKEMGLSIPFNKFNVQIREHFITEEKNGKVDYADGPDHVYALPSAEVLDATCAGEVPGVNNCHVKMSVNSYGKGRTFYLSGLRYNAMNTRIFYRALLWCAGKEDLLYKAFSQNVNTECHYYPESKRYALVNNTSQPQDTVFFDVNGLKKAYSLKPNEILWIDEK